MRRRRDPEIIAGHCDANGAIVAAQGEFSSRFVSTGNYVLTFPSSFRLVSITGNVDTSASSSVVTMTVQGNSVTVAIYVSNTAAAVNLGFHFTATGVQQ